MRPPVKYVDVLLVEDDPSDAELTLNALQSHNLVKNIFIARDGQEALDFVRAVDLQGERFPRLILLDLKLPKVDGFQVLRCLKSNERTKPIPVVVFTSSNLEGDIYECYKLGANGYVQKPVDYDMFVKTVSEVSGFWLSINSPPSRGTPLLHPQRRAG